MDHATIAPPKADETEEIFQADPVLTSKDRCDSCGAQAYVRASFESGDLLFCNHHYRRFQTKIDDGAVRIIDESWMLTDKRLDVSPA